MAAPAGRRAPYKDFLQPALHRRFASTATILLGIAYIQSLFLSSWSSYLWAWFPIGPAGFRTGMLFLCGLLVIILRIADYHVGIRATNSVFHGFTLSLLRLSTYETLLWYMLSATVFFLPVFLWTYSDSPDMHWIVYKAGDRARLNEKPLFLAYYLVSCAILQAVEHLFRDEDQLTLGHVQPSGKSGSQPADTSKVVNATLARLPVVVLEAAARSVAAFFVHLALYFALFRSFAWGWTLFAFRPFYSLPKTNMVPPYTPLGFNTMKTCMFAGLLLFVIWRTGNAAFSTFMVKEPLKNGKPLTNDSKDPNGSLLNGLKSKRPPIRAYAMWELAYIASDFEERRKAIFEDIDRKDGPVWSQIYGVCLDLVKSIGTHIDDYGKKPTPPPAAVVEDVKSKATAPPKGRGDIFQSRPAPKSMRSEAGKALDSVARSPGETPISRLSPRAKKALSWTRDRLLNQDRQDALQPNNVMGTLRRLSVACLNVNVVGAFFGQSYRRRLLAATLGGVGGDGGGSGGKKVAASTAASSAGDEAEPVLCVNAITALSELAVHSLGEDKFGNVHRDVPTLVRTFTGTIRKLEAFRDGFPLHWTDVEGTREAPEVDMVLDALRAGLTQLIEAFEPYRNDLRLTLTDMRVAKEAAGVKDKATNGAPKASAA